MKGKRYWKRILGVVCILMMLSGCGSANVTDEVGGWEQGRKEQETEGSGETDPEQEELTGTLTADVTPVDDEPFQDFDPSDYNTDTPGEGVEIFVERTFGPWMLLRCENHGNVSYESVKFELQLQSDFPDNGEVMTSVSAFRAVPPYGTAYYVYGPKYVENVVMKGGDSGDRIFYEDIQPEDIVSLKITGCEVSEDLYVDIRPYVNVAESIDVSANRWGYLQNDSGMVIGTADITLIVDGKEVVRLNRGGDRSESGTPLEPAEIQYPLARDGMSYAEWENVKDQYNELDLSQSHTYEVIIESLKCRWKE